MKNEGIFSFKIAIAGLLFVAITGRGSGGSGIAEPESGKQTSGSLVAGFDFGSEGLNKALMAPAFGSSQVDVSDITKPGDGQVTISWDSVAGADSYNIYWFKTPGVTKSTGTLIPNVTSPYAHTGLTNSTDYFYIVTASNGAGESADSKEVTVSPNLIVYLEGVENGLGLWAPSQGTWEVGVPASGPNAAHTGTGVVATVLAGNYTTTNSGLISPSI